MAFPHRENGGTSPGEGWSEEKVRDTALTGFVPVDSTIKPVDTVLAGLGKSQGQIDAIRSSVGAPEGLAKLDANGKIDADQMPGGLYRFQGFWEPETNTPALSNDMPGLTGGEFYVCRGGGSHDFGGGEVEFHDEDVLMFSAGDSSWIKHSHHTGSVESVNGKTGKALTLDATEIKMSETDQRSIKDAISANHSRVHTIKTLSSAGEEAYLDFGGIRWGCHYLTVNTLKQFYMASGDPVVVDFMQKSHYDAAIEPRQVSGLTLTGTKVHYDPLFWSEGRERTEALFMVDGKLWEAHMIVFGRTTMKAIIWAEQIF